MGEPLRECTDEMCGNVTLTAVQYRCRRGSLSRLRNGQQVVSANMAPTPDDIGWVAADQWMRMQASKELAKPRCDRAAADVRVPPRTGGTLILAQCIGHGAD